ncbi:MAG TPA: hypothetical protein VEK73_09980 [Xanthobacteraceae bacterium]|nr:hypothetical protein [Xanthobacteraceae bacterium]
MKLKFIVAVSVLVAMPAVAHAQAKGAKPTKADADKVVQIVSADKAKVAAYCDLAKLGDDIDAAAQKKDQKKMDDLNKQADALQAKLGPEYAKLMASLESIDPDSKEGKEFNAAFEPLDKLCGK